MCHLNPWNSGSVYINQGGPGTPQPEHVGHLHPRVRQPRFEFMRHDITWPLYVEIVPDLQHVRPADAPERRPRGVELHRPGAEGGADHTVRDGEPVALLLLRGRPCHRDDRDDGLIISGRIQGFFRGNPLPVGPRSSCKNAPFRGRSRLGPWRHGRCVTPDGNHSPRGNRPMTVPMERVADRILSIRGFRRRKFL